MPRPAQKRGRLMEECHPLDNSLSHVPDVKARRIVRTALGIEMSRSPSEARSPPRIGPATNDIHRESEKAHTRKPSFCHPRFSETQKA
jgi:hypothetical protein